MGWAGCRGLHKWDGLVRGWWCHGGGGRPPRSHVAPKAVRVCRHTPPPLPPPPRWLAGVPARAAKLRPESRTRGATLGPMPAQAAWLCARDTAPAAAPQGSLEGGAQRHTRRSGGAAARVPPPPQDGRPQRHRSDRAVGALGVLVSTAGTLRLIVERRPEWAQGLLTVTLFSLVAALPKLRPKWWARHRTWCLALVRYVGVRCPPHRDTHSWCCQHQLSAPAVLGPYWHAIACLPAHPGCACGAFQSPTCQCRWSTTPDTLGGWGQRWIGSTC